MSLGATISRQHQKELQNRTYKGRIIIFSSWENYHFFDSQASVALTSSFCHWWSNTNCSLLSSMLKGSCPMGKEDLSQDHVFKVKGQGHNWKNRFKFFGTHQKQSKSWRLSYLAYDMPCEYASQATASLFLFMPSKVLSTKLRWTNENKSQSPMLGSKW